MALFRNRDPERRVAVPDNGGLGTPIDEEVHAPVSRLIASGKVKTVDKAIDDARRAAEEAQSAEIVGARLIEQGRCPECHGKLSIMIFTRACPACGWFSRAVPSTGRCTVFLGNGETIRCDAAITVRGDQFLCVTDGVVRAQVLKSFINMIEYDWSEEELERARADAHRQKEGICAWCEKVYAGLPEGPVEEYVALGSFQERYSFCCEKCAAAFRRQYPPRVHRNCYERDCNTCSLCIRRYDTRGIKTTNFTT